MWADYITELHEGQTVFIEEDFGFISYCFPAGGNTIYARDIYIKPEQRNASNAFNLLGRVEEAGLRAGKTEIVFSVVVNSSSASKNVRLYLAMGFFIVEAQNGMIWLRRPIKRKVEV